MFSPNALQPQQDYKVIPTVTVDQNAVTTTTVTIRDRDGNPYSFVDGDTVAFVTKADWSDSAPTINVAGTIGANSVVSVNLTATNTGFAGCFTAEYLVSGSDTNLKYIYPVYFIVNPNLSVPPSTTCWVPTIAEIRLMLRDVSANNNFLLDQVEFANEEIMYAIRSPIEEFNEVSPTIPVVYTPTTFPYRYHWKKAIVAELMLMAAQRYRRNSLTYRSDSVMVDDMNKFQEYEGIGRQYKQEWQQWMLMKKWELNAAYAFSQYDTFDDSRRWY